MALGDSESRGEARGERERAPVAGKWAVRAAVTGRAEREAAIFAAWPDGLHEG